MRIEIKEKAHALIGDLGVSLFWPMLGLYLLMVLSCLLIVGIPFTLAFMYMGSIFIMKYVKTGKRTFSSISEECRDRTRVYALARPAGIIFAILFVFSLISSLVQLIFNAIGVYWLKSLVNLVFSIAGIVLSLFVSIDFYFVAYLMYDSDYSLTTKEVLTLSRRMAEPIRWEILVFELSFILHWLLVCVTLGIYSIWFLPYRETCRVLYYNAKKADFLAQNHDTLADRIREYVPPAHDEDDFDNDDFDFEQFDYEDTRVKEDDIFGDDKT